MKRRHILQIATTAPVAFLNTACNQFRSALPVTVSQTPTEMVAIGAPAQPALGDQALLRQRYAPCSTFKIPLTLMVLEERLVEDVNRHFDVDKSTFQPEPWWLPSMIEGWNKPHSLRSAYGASAIWLYRKLAKQLGEQRVAQYLEMFDYGDRNIAYGVDNFWNAGDRGLKISPLEQCRFLEQLAQRRFPLRSSTYEQALDIFAAQQRDGYSITSKSGLGWHAIPEQSLAMGWLVGWLQTETAPVGGQNIIPFASYCDAPSIQQAIERRRLNAQTALKQRGWSL